ncbi:hypothetical protein, partial [Pedobacter petrophilus]|uniref:hypothetical protein n=1 Tax=Pedobacter petrophilus TaxID=1908241 RepID=UPI001AE05F12
MKDKGVLIFWGFAPKGELCIYCYHFLDIILAIFSASIVTKNPVLLFTDYIAAFLLYLSWPLSLNTKL